MRQRRDVPQACAKEGMYRRHAPRKGCTAGMRQGGHIGKERWRMEKYRRIFVIVVDSLGVGAMEDSPDFGDVGVNTLGHI